MAVRQIQLKKGPKGFGFNLSRVDGRNVFRVVDEGGPAHQAGARVGDEILSVNGTTMINASHGDLVKAIKGAGDVVPMEVKSATATAAPAAAKGPGVVSGTPINIIKGPNGFGFNLSKVEGRHVFRVVDAGGAADRAGARPGDVILQVAGQDVTQLPHGDVVKLIKGSGDAVKMVIQVSSKPTLSAAGAAGVNPIILEQQMKAEREKNAAVLRAQAAIASAKADTEKALAEQQEAEDRLRKAREAEQRQQDLTKELKLLDARLEKVMATWGELDDQVEEQTTQTKSIASFAELRDFNDLMEKVEASAKNELKAELAKIGKNDDADELTKRLHDKALEVKYAELGEELARIRLGELKRLTEEAKKRRAEESKKEERKQEDIKAARERDLQLLREKQERMDRMLREAQEARQAEEAARQAEKAAKDAAMAEERAARAEEVERIKFERQEAKKKRLQEEERRQQREAEERAYQEKDAERRRKIAEEKREREEDERKRKNAANVFGGALKSRAPPAQDNSVHPMIALMAQQREADTRF